MTGKSNVESESFNRREFVGLCASALIAPMLAGCASLVARPVTPVNGRIELSLHQHPDLMRAGGAVKLLPVGTVEPVYVLRLHDGEFAALSPICTHLGCTVEIQGPRLVCPCHGSTYDRSGQVLVGPAARPLKRYPVGQHADGTITVELVGAP